MKPNEIMAYVNERTYRSMKYEEALYHSICLEGKSADECKRYLDGII